MAVQIGAKTHDFSDPTGLLSDCHRRIEMFLRALESVAVLIDHPLSNQARTALESALRYFREAAPKHTADEEESLFPRLRQSMRSDVQSAIQRLEPLEHDHRIAGSLHATVEDLGKKGLAHGSLPADQARLFRECVAKLVSIYQEHIQVEDELVFPVAKRVLSSTDKESIAKEMAARRNTGTN